MRKCVLHHLSFAIFYTINQPRGLSFGTILRKSLQTTLRFLNYGCSELTWGPAVRFHCRWWSEVSPGWRWVGPPACCFPRSRSPPPSAAGSPATDKHWVSPLWLHFLCFLYWNELESFKTIMTTPVWWVTFGETCCQEIITRGKHFWLPFSYFYNIVTD